MNAGEWPEGFTAEPEAEDGIVCEDVGGVPESRTGGSSSGFRC